MVQPEVRIDLPVLDLRDYPQVQQQAEAERLMKAEALRSFDLSRDPMLRATLLRVSPASGSGTLDRAGESAPAHILLLTLHHIASDGWSAGVLLRELSTLYGAFRQGQSSPLPPLSLQYADFAVWQRQRLQGERLERQLNYWKSRLAGAPDLLQLPTDRPRPAEQSFRGDAVTLAIGTELTQHLRRLSQAHNTTLYTTLLSAFQILMSRYSGQSDLVVGSPIANRNYAQLEQLIGFFVNTLAWRADLGAIDGRQPSFLDVLAQMQALTKAAYDHQDLPFERLIEELQPPRNLNYNPLVQVGFALQNAPMGELELAGLRVTHGAAQVHTTRMDLEMHCWEVGDQLHGNWVFSTDLFDRSTIERMAGHFRTLLQAIVDNPAQSITELPLLTAAERHQVLVRVERH